MERPPITYQYKNDIFVSLEEKTVPFHIAAFTSHNAYEIYILLEGERRVYIGDRIYDTGAGSAVLIGAGVPHRSEGNTPYRGICLQFTERQLDRLYTPGFKEQLLACFAREAVFLEKNTLAELQLVLYHMLAEPEHKNFYLPAALAIFLREMERGENDGTAENHKKVTSVSLQSVEDYLQENMREIRGLDEIAAHFCITKGYLCTLFKKQTGMTVIGYLNNLRIQEACRLLTDTEASVEQICALCGFRSEVYFYRLFKKMMRETPSGYRTLIRRSH